MKPIVLLVSVITLTCISCSQKTVSVPGPVKSGFEKQFPGVTPKWEKEASMYEANFKTGGKETSAVFDANGKMMESEVEIPMSELPKAVTDYLEQHYKGIKIKETARITTADGKTEYEVAIKGKDLIFDASGNFIKEIAD